MIKKKQKLCSISAVPTIDDEINAQNNGITRKLYLLVQVQGQSGLWSAVSFQSDLNVTATEVQLGLENFSIFYI